MQRSAVTRRRTVDARAQDLKTPPGLIFLVLCAILWLRACFYPRTRLAKDLGTGTSVVIPTDVGDKPLSIVQQHVAEIRQLGFLAFALPMQHRLGIGRRLMGVIAPPGRGV